MKNKFAFEKKNGYLYFTITGEYDRNDFRSYALLLMTTCKNENTYKVLVNAADVKGANLSIMERYIIGEKMAELIPSEIKIAVVWPAQHINKFAETVAVNRGGFLYVTGNLEEAEKWLLTPI